MFAVSAEAIKPNTVNCEEDGKFEFVILNTALFWNLLANDVITADVEDVLGTIVSVKDSVVKDGLNNVGSANVYDNVTVSDIGIPAVTAVGNPTTPPLVGPDALYRYGEYSLPHSSPLDSDVIDTPPLIVFDLVNELE